MSLVRNVQRSGQPLPQCIQYALQYLRRTSLKQQGIFRKSGVKTRIAKLRQFCEENPDGSDFCEYRENSPYDIADLGLVKRNSINASIKKWARVLKPKKSKCIYESFLNHWWLSDYQILLQQFSSMCRLNTACAHSSLLFYFCLMRIAKCYRTDYRFQ